MHRSDNWPEILFFELLLVTNCPNLNMADAPTTIQVRKVVVQLPSLDQLAPIYFKLLVYALQSSLLVMSALMVFVLLKNVLLTP